MSFLIKKIFSKLRHNAGVYAFLVLEFALGVSFLVFARNAELSVKELQDYYYKNYTATTVSMTVDAAQTLGRLGITPQDVQLVQGQFPTAQLRYQLIQYVDFLCEGSVTGCKAVYCDLPEFAETADTVFAGKNAMRILTSGVTEDLAQNYRIEGNTLVVQGRRLALQPLPARLAGEQRAVFPTVFSSFFSLDDALLLPVWQDGLTLPQTNLATLEWDVAGQPDADKKLGFIQEALYQAHEGYYSFRIEYPLRDFEKNIADGLRLHFIAGKLGGLMFLELLIGFSGLMLLFLKKREKELAICLAVGAKRWALALELLCELGAICALGFAVGAIVGSAMTELSNRPDLALQTHTYASALLPGLAAAVFVTLISAAPMLYKIYTAQPDRILRGE